MKIGLNFAEQLPPIVREELQQLVASLQSTSQRQRLLDGKLHTDTVAQTVSRGSLIYGSTAIKWDELVIGVANRVLRSNGTDVSWAQVVLTSDVSGILPVGSGGTAVATLTTNGVLYGNAATSVLVTAQGAANSVLTANAGAPVFSASPTVTALTTTAAVTVGTSLDLSAAAAGQVVFPATQNDSANANTLDDYEEGTWTPVLTFVTPGDLSVAYSLQAGSYTKIGHQVRADFLIATSTFTHTTASGACRLTGLPFTSGATYYASGAPQIGGVTKAGYTQFIARVIPSVTYIDIIGNASGLSASNVAAADMPTGGAIVFLGTVIYRV